MKRYKDFYYKIIYLLVLCFALLGFLSCIHIFNNTSSLETYSTSIGINYSNFFNYTVKASIDSNKWQRDRDNNCWRSRIEKFYVSNGKESNSFFGFQFYRYEKKYEIKVVTNTSKDRYHPLNVCVYGMLAKPNKFIFLQKQTNSGFQLLSKDNFTIDGQKPTEIEFSQVVSIEENKPPVVNLYFEDNVLNDHVKDPAVEKPLYKLGILYTIKGKYNIQSNIEKNEWEKTQVNDEWIGKLHKFKVYLNGKEESRPVRGFLEKKLQNSHQYFVLEVPPIRKKNPSLIVYVKGFSKRPSTLYFQKKFENTTKNQVVDISGWDFLINEKNPQKIDFLETKTDKYGHHPVIKLHYNKLYKINAVDNQTNTSKVSSKAINVSNNFVQNTDEYNPYSYYTIGLRYPPDSDYKVTGTIDTWTKKDDKWLGRLFTFYINDKRNPTYYKTGFYCTTNTYECERKVSFDSKNYSNKTSLYVYLHGFIQKPTILNFSQNHISYDDPFHNLVEDNFRIGSMIPNKIKIGDKYNSHPVIHLYYNNQYSHNFTIITEGYQKFKHNLTNCYIELYKNNKKIDQFPLNSRNFSKDISVKNITKVILASPFGNLHYQEIKLNFGYKRYRINLHQYALELQIQDSEGKAISNSIVDIRMKKYSPLNDINKNVNIEHSKNGCLSYINILPWFRDNEQKTYQDSYTTDIAEESTLSIFTGRTDSQGKISFINFNHLPWNELIINAYARGYFYERNKIVSNGKLILKRNKANIKEYYGKITIKSDADFPVNKAFIGITSEKSGIVYFTGESNNKGEIRYNFSSISEEKKYLITAFKHGYKQSGIRVQTNPFSEYDYQLKLKLLSMKINQVSLIILNEKDVLSFFKAKQGTLDFLNYIHWSTTSNKYRIKVAAAYDDNIKNLQSISDIENEIAKPLSYCALKDQFKQAVEKQKNISNIIYIMDKKFILSVTDQWDDFFQALEQINKYLTINFIIIGNKDAGGYYDTDIQNLVQKTSGKIYYCNNKKDIFKILYEIFDS